MKVEELLERSLAFDVNSRFSVLHLANASGSGFSGNLLGKQRDNGADCSQLD